MRTDSYIERYNLWYVMEHSGTMRAWCGYYVMTSPCLASRFGVFVLKFLNRPWLYRSCLLSKFAILIFWSSHPLYETMVCKVSVKTRKIQIKFKIFEILFAHISFFVCPLLISKQLGNCQMCCGQTKCKNNWCQDVFRRDIIYCNNQTIHRWLRAKRQQLHY